MCDFFEKEIHHIIRNTPLVKSCNKETNYQFLMLDWSYIPGRSLNKSPAKHGVRSGVERGCRMTILSVYKTPGPRMQQIHKWRLAWDSRVPRNVSCHPGGDDCIGGSSEVYWVYLSSMFPAYQADLEIGCGSMKMLFGTICSLHQHGSLSAWSNMLLQIFMFLVWNLYMHIQTSYTVNRQHLVASVMFLPAEIPYGSKHHGCPFHDIILQRRGTNTSSVPASFSWKTMAGDGAGKSVGYFRLDIPKRNDPWSASRY